MADIKYTKIALSDLDAIADYIENELFNPIAAYNTVNKIQDSIDNLSTFPLMGKSLSSVVNINTDYRFLVCGKYLAFYRYEDNTVFIDRIIYGKRDYISILFGNVLDDNDN